MRSHRGTVRIAMPSLLGLAFVLQFAHVGHDHDHYHDPVESEQVCMCVHFDRSEGDVDSLPESATTTVGQVVASLGADARPVPSCLYGLGARGPPTA